MCSSDLEKEHKEALLKRATMECPAIGTDLCPFAWIGKSIRNGAPKNSTQGRDKAIAPILLSKGSWKYAFEKHEGWVPQDGEAPLVLQMKVSQPIRKITFFVMQSYGEKFEGSQASAVVALKNSTGTEFSLLKGTILSGYHNRTTSETKPIRLTLDDTITVDSLLKIELWLTGGTTFKLMGLTICS